MEPLLISWPRMPRSAKFFEYEQQRMVHEKEEHDPWAQQEAAKGAIYDDYEDHECFCNKCGIQLGSGDDWLYCYSCVESMDEEFAEKAMRKKKRCTNCGQHFKQTEVGIRCECDLMTYGRYMSHGL
jgi:hypothetical protein